MKILYVLFTCFSIAKLTTVNVRSQVTSDAISPTNTHVYFTLKGHGSNRGNHRFYVVSMWNTGSVFVGKGPWLFAMWKLKVNNMNCMSWS